MSLGVAPAPLQLSFVQGFVVGQAVLFLGIAFLLRFLFVADVPSSLERQRADLIARTVALQKSLDARGKSRSRIPQTRSSREMEEILHKVQYDMHGHQPESLDWLNVLLAQIISKYREDVATSAHGEAAAPPGIPLPSIQNGETLAAKEFVERALNSVVAGRTMNLLVRRRGALWADA